MSWKQIKKVASATVAGSMWILVFPVAVEEGAETWQRWLGISDIQRFVDIMNILYQEFGPASMMLAIAASLWWWCYWYPPRWLPHRQRVDFEKIAQPAQAWLDALIKAAEGLELPWMLPDNWASLRAQIVALEQELGRLDVPRPSVPSPMTSRRSTTGWSTSVMWPRWPSTVASQMPAPSSSART